MLKVVVLCGVAQQGLSGELLGHGTVRPVCHKGPPDQPSVDPAAKEEPLSQVELTFKQVHVAGSF